MRSSVLIALAALFMASEHASAQPTFVDGRVALESYEDLAYPPILISARTQGVVVLHVMLSQSGQVDTVSPISGDKLLIKLTTENIKKWKFRPNPSREVVVVYEFSTESGTCREPGRSLFRLKHYNFASITTCSPHLGIGE